MLFFELIQVAIGRRDSLTITPSESEWLHLYQLSEQHALLGVCFNGVTRLPREQWPPESLLADWIWQVQRIKEQNEQITRRSVEICAHLAADGFNTCLLKGQGNARLYGDLADYRQAGDVDIWVTPVKRTRRNAKRLTIEYVRQHYPDVLLRFHHVEYPMFADTLVELHFLPIYLNNPRLNRHLNAWYRGQHDIQMQHQVEIGGEMVAVPTKEFNLLYQLLHIYKHIFEEGIGLRQLMDYYFVLVGEMGMSKNEYWARHWELTKLIKMLKLEALAGSVMYVMKEVFDMPDKYLVCPPLKAEGISFLSEIMQSGNFGHFDTRYEKADFGKGFTAQLHRFWRKTKRNIALSWHYPHEGLWEPLFRIYHYFWRTFNLWKI